MKRYPEIASKDMYFEQRRVFEAVSARRKGGVEGPFLPLVHVPGILDCLQALGEHCRFHTGVSDKLRELAILVTAKHVVAPLEFHVHAIVARRFGLSEEIISAVAGGRRPDTFDDDDEALVHDFSRTLFVEGRVSDDLFWRANARFGKAVVIDLVATCGYYAMLGLGMNVTQAPIPPAYLADFVPAFPVPPG
jgi:4-carboxymuconolactone decarboxylase